MSKRSWRTENPNARRITRQPTFNCPVCGDKGLVRSSERLSRLVIEIRYACARHACGHTWINHNTYVSTVSPAAEGSVKAPILHLKSRPLAPPPDPAIVTPT